eukprot:TRINITY_DN25691_c0_g2_i1.p4 TRINITY_DN25691_c0_g2~~TRINITY_DN25691_c0_g2_i1.p4  ORF type:complete len:121 (+),score=7.18 TRINITY_DN25691_c0_g2_i1:1615-1977(+)
MGALEGDFVRRGHQLEYQPGNEHEKGCDNSRDVKSEGELPLLLRRGVDIRRNTIGVPEAVPAKHAKSTHHQADDHEAGDVMTRAAATPAARRAFHGLRLRMGFLTLWVRTRYRGTDSILS